MSDELVDPDPFLIATVVIGVGNIMSTVFSGYQAKRQADVDEERIYRETEIPDQPPTATHDDMNQALMTLIDAVGRQGAIVEKLAAIAERHDLDEVPYQPGTQLFVAPDEIETIVLNLPLEGHETAIALIRSAQGIEPYLDKEDLAVAKQLGLLSEVDQ